MELMDRFLAQFVSGGAARLATSLHLAQKRHVELDKGAVGPGPREE